MLGCIDESQPRRKIGQEKRHMGSWMAQTVMFRPRLYGRPGLEGILVGWLVGQSVKSDRDMAAVLAY